MPLSLESRRLGEVTVVRCSGGIVEGPEYAVLELPADLATRDPGEAGRELVDRVPTSL